MSPLSAGLPNIPIPQYFDLNRAIMPQDIPHKFVVSGILRSAIRKGKTILERRRGFRPGQRLADELLTKQSGPPFSVSAAATVLNAPGSTHRADPVLPSVEALGGVGHASVSKCPVPRRGLQPTATNPTAAMTLNSNGTVNNLNCDKRYIRLDLRFSW